MEEPTVRDNPEAGQYEIIIGDHTAMAAYVRRHDTITFTHTEVPRELEGKGLAGKIVRFALEDARAKQLRVIAVCPYVVGYLEKHPEYQDLTKGR